MGSLGLKNVYRYTGDFHHQTKHQYHTDLGILISCPYILQCGGSLGVELMSAILCVFPIVLIRLYDLLSMLMGFCSIPDSVVSLHCTRLLRPSFMWLWTFSNLKIRLLATKNTSGL